MLFSVAFLNLYNIGININIDSDIYIPVYIQRLMVIDMTMISLYKIVKIPKLKEIKAEDLNIKIISISKDRITFQIIYKEPISEIINRGFKEIASDILERLKDFANKTLEIAVEATIYKKQKVLVIRRGRDHILYRILKKISKYFGEISPISLDSKSLLELARKYGSEVKLAMFKNVDGLFYEILRGRHLEANEKFKRMLKRNKDSLKVIGFYMKNSWPKFQVTINGDKGTIRYYENGFERSEISLIVNAMINMHNAFNNYSG